MKWMEKTMDEMDEENMKKTFTGDSYSLMHV